MTERNANNSGRPLRLGPNEVHVYWAEMDERATDLATLSSLLSTQERERAARFLVPIERDRFIATRATLRELLGTYAQIEPASLLIETLPRGKPRLSASSAVVDIRFNVSHAHGKALFAFCLGREVGVDIEQIGPDFATEDIARHYFSAHEHSELAAVPAELRAEAFFRCWTRKEAYIKARGDGLSLPLDSFSVSLKPNEPARLCSPDCQNWTIYDLEMPSGFVGALVVEGSECRVLYSGFSNRSVSTSRIPPRSDYP